MLILYLYETTIRSYYKIYIKNLREEKSDSILTYCALSIMFFEEICQTANFIFHVLYVTVIAHVYKLSG